MKGLAALRDAAGSLLARSPARWIVLSLVVAAVLGTAVYSYRQIDSELTAVALSRRGAVAQLAAAVLAEKFGRLVDVAISLATRVRLRDLVAEDRWTEAIEIMRAVPRDLPHIERLFLTDTAGTLMADAPALPGVRGRNFASREWFQGVRRDWRPYVSPVYTRPAAILTSSKEEQDLINGYRLGANSYIRKPVDFGQFMQAVRSLGLYWLVLNEMPPGEGDRP
jgi:hypothetical protein